MNSFQPIHYDHHGITGGIAVSLYKNQSIDNFCKEYIPEYHTDRFEAIAIRLYTGKETIITIYALDKHHPNHNPNKLPVKKFKVTNIALEELLCFFETITFTLTKDSFNIEELEVLNK